MNSTVIKILLFLLFSVAGTAQELLPFVENYSKSNYQGDNQIWNVTQGTDKAMYFANNHYLLRYNGVVWEKYNLPNKTIIRSIMADSNKVYSGSYKEFGYWTREKGVMNYTSLSQDKNVFAENENEEIWKIFKVKETIYFQSFNEIFALRNGVISKTKFPFLISYCFIVDDQIYVASVESGVFIFTGKKFIPVKGWEVLKHNVVHSIEKHQNEIYIFTQRSGIFISVDGKLSAWKNSLNNLLKTGTINVAKFIKKNKLAIGTGSKGVFIVDLNTNEYQTIDRNNVLMNNSVLSIAVDQENDLWLGLDNGISHIEVNSPISIFYDNTGVLGSVYDVAPTPKGYLIASNHGIFEYKNRSFSLLPNTQGQAWDISEIDSKYLIGHNSGTFLYQNEQLSLLNSINGGWNLTKSAINNTYFQANYTGISIYNRFENFSQNVLVSDLVKPMKYVAQNKKNELWAADNYKGLYRILYDDNYKTKTIENITQLSKIKNDFGVIIFEFRNEILFLIDNTWYTYNSILNKLEENKLFNTNFKNCTDIVAIDSSQFIVLKEGILYYILAQKNTFIWNIIQEKYYKGKLINDYLKIFKNKENYLLNLDDGFISLELKHRETVKTPILIDAFANGIAITTNEKIGFNSEVNFNIISNLYGSRKPNLFYTINNAQDFILVKNGRIFLSNLISGNQKLEIFSNDGSKYQKLKEYNFLIGQPWYFSLWMIVLYVLVSGSILFLYYKWNKMRYIQKLLLQEEELKHQKTILEMELKAEHELNTQEYEKHILELELQTKSSEVAGKSLSIAKQSEMIENIQSILDKEADINKIKSEIRKAIKINSVNKHEWEIFETNLNQIHSDFIIKLSQRFPVLTSKDIKLCIYLKMNLSSKEIAPLMNISFRGVELQRYRLRKKLELVQEESLSKFLLTL
ncbi:histidine kinase [Flavobacterium sp. TMP13]|uniref:helix-turn-helix and ligand-binding sensor domain-containing protein n=1 Tax=Flavobacterium sp. TMP13 TaxID=3425950 RepID=UPI003D77912F